MVKSELDKLEAEIRPRIVAHLEEVVWPAVLEEFSSEIKAAHARNDPAEIAALKARVNARFAEVSIAYMQRMREEISRSYEADPQFIDIRGEVN